MYRVFAIAILIFAACAGNAFAQFDPKYNVEVPVKRLALVVGNADYVNAEVLPGSAKDADAIAEKLRAAGFTVTLAKNIATRADFLNKYFLDFLEKIEEGSFVVFYFSGHGFTYGGESYLAPLQVPQRLPGAQVFTTFISTSALQERINLHNPALLVMLLDACRNISGFIDSSAGGPSDVEKGLASLAPVQNNIVGYASAPGKISIGSSAGAYSKYTAALLAHLITVDEEFDKAHKEVIADVRNNTSNGQNPWLSASSTLDVYFNPSPVVLDQFRDAWQAAQQSDTPDAAKRYLDLFALGPYAVSARKWLAERTQRASTFTQFSPGQIDSLWQDALGTPAFGTRITGPFGFSRVGSQNQPTIQSRDLGERKQIQPGAREVAGVLAGNQDVIVLEPTTARFRPDATAAPAGSLDVGARIVVTSVEEDNQGAVWLKASSKQFSQAFYVPVPPTAGTLDVSIGKALLEFDLDAASRGSAGIASQLTIDNALKGIKAAGQRINWISISVPKTDPNNVPFSEREALLLSARATHGAYLLSKTIPRGRITIVDGADFSGTNPRVRIFGN